MSEPSEEAIRRTLEARARALALPLTGEARGVGDEVVIFVVGRAKVALPTQFVRAVRPMTALALIPGAPPNLAGVALIDGTPLAVWRLGAVVGDPDPPAAWTRLMLIGQKTIELVVGVTAVEGFVRADAATLTRGGVELMDGRALIADPRLSA